MDISEIRRLNLQAIVDFYGLAVASKRFKKPDRQINDMLKKRKPFGEKVTRKMELNFLPDRENGWLSIPNIDPKTLESKDTLKTYSTSDPIKQSIIELVLKMDSKSLNKNEFVGSDPKNSDDSRDDEPKQTKSKRS